MYREKNQPVGVNTPLFLLAEGLNKMVLTINIDESDIGYIKVGQQVIFTVSAFPEKRFTGKIQQVRINPVKSGSLVSYQSIVICDNDELLLKPGMTATATVVIDEKKDVIRVLNQAFMVTPDDEDISGSSKGKIWIKSGVVGKPYKGIEVKTGLSGDLYTEIISGLSGNEEVLIRIKGK
jgi:HlyD family secretion protein